MTKALFAAGVRMHFGEKNSTWREPCLLKNCCCTTIIGGGCFYGLESFYNAAALTAISSVDTARPSDQIQRRTGM